ncbi:hypothetical protein [Asticcacaulis sp.]|uniref:hypothetical protein n=1 Tax=Asticcacaulis sp. TaxID=1872648 RepID=UPI002B526F36|nr:hypothetical protein [Asticcacaulis sp.]HTM79797.1 hypothetical protein [Asticcacaulis sp.]
MMKSVSLLAGAALLAVSAISAPAFAEGSFSNPSSQKCATAQEEMAGRQIADSLSERIRDTAPAQSKRLIKIEGCQVSHGVVKTYFTYNYLAEKTAYAVEGQAVVDAAGAVTLAQVEKPGIVFASIDSNYVE